MVPIPVLPMWIWCTPMISKVLQKIEKEQLLRRGDRVLVAYSGGADSTALLHLLFTHAKELGISVEAAHVNHGLRSASEQEEQAVRAYCSEWGVPLFVYRAELSKKEKPHKMGIEEWAREVRYSFLEDCAQSEGALLATAHTLSDNAETMLLNLARGAGVQGLAGIPPMRGNIIRPLLTVSRQEVEAYCLENRLSFVTDESNLTDDYARNRLRHAAVPALLSVNGAALRNMGAAAEDLREVYVFLAQEAAARLLGAQVAGGYSAALIAQAPAPVRSEMLRRLAGPDPAIDRAREKLCEQLLYKEGAVQLSKSRRAIQKGGTLSFVSEISPAPAQPFSFLLREGEFTFPEGLKLQISCLSYPDYLNICQNQKNLLKNGADCDKIFGTVLVRSRKEKDRITLPGRAVTKTLKKWMNESKIPPSLRGRLPLLCRESEVLFCPGVGFANGLSPSKDTRRVLYLRLFDIENLLEEAKCTAM